MVEQQDENLGTLIKHIIYNELSQARNPNNMPLFAALFQFAPEKASKVQHMYSSASLSFKIFRVKILLLGFRHLYSGLFSVLKELARVFQDLLIQR